MEGLENAQSLCRSLTLEEVVQLFLDFETGSMERAVVERGLEAYVVMKQQLKFEEMWKAKHVKKRDATNSQELLQQAEHHTRMCSVCGRPWPPNMDKAIAQEHGGFDARTTTARRKSSRYNRQQPTSQAMTREMDPIRSRSGFVPAHFEMVGVNHFWDDVHHIKEVLANSFPWRRI